MFRFWGGAKAVTIPAAHEVDDLKGDIVVAHIANPALVEKVDNTPLDYNGLKVLISIVKEHYATNEAAKKKLDEIEKILKPNDAKAYPDIRAAIAQLYDDTQNKAGKGPASPTPARHYK